MNHATGVIIETRRNAAYTLIELIIAMVLVAALMSSIWGIMSLYNSLLTAGRSGATQQQLVRSLFQIIEEDVAAVVVQPDSHDAAMLFEDSSSDGDSVMQQAVPLTPLLGGQREDPPSQLSLVGTSNAMRMTLQRHVPRTRAPPSDIDLLNELGGGSIGQTTTSNFESSPPVPEFQTVVYQFESFASSGGAAELPAGLYRTQADAAEFGSLLAQRSTAERNMSQSSVAISRQTLEQLLFPPDDPLADQSLQPTGESTAANVELVPEVVDCRFTYFDGQAWSSEWSASQAGTLPKAIGVSLSLATASELETLRNHSASGGDNGVLEREFGASPPVDSAGNAADDAFDSFAVVQATRFHRIILLDATPSPQPGEQPFRSSREEL
jgi:prepilin-type N-terminal cleavage/methylation domain-containing protein